MKRVETRRGDTETRRRGDKESAHGSVAIVSFFAMSPRLRFISASPRLRVSASFFVLLFACLASGCRQDAEKQSVRPVSLRDVPAQRLAFSFKPDIATPSLASADDPAKLERVQKDFETRRTEDALVRAIVSPDGQRVLALYETGDLPRGEFRIDIYSSDGMFLTNVTPPQLSCTFAPVVAWSPDGNSIAFIARKSLAPEPEPTPPDAPPEVGQPAPAPSVGRAFAPVQTFSTEQIYICDRDGNSLHPLTTRDGLIYFHLAWAPDAHALAALACKSAEWDENEAARQAPAGRPRVIALDGSERLLDDELKDALPVWSPDSSKIATAFDTDVWIYDAAANAPTSARLPLRDALRNSSVAFDAEHLSSSKKKTDGGKNGGAQTAPQTGGPPKSFAPIIRLDWTQPETLLIQTGYIRVYPSAPEYPRWHELHLSPQAALISRHDSIIERRPTRLS
ncbi:MAG: TolB protein [Blastocatellia bacterium]|nr:TolB protein [Blastocatellia bacterium]